MKARMYRYDNLKFFLIVCIIIGHIIEPYYKQTAFLKGMYYFVYVFHVPAFIFISGMFSKKALSDRIKTKESVVHFLVLFALYEVLRSVLHLCWGKGASYTPLGVTSISWYIFCLAIWYAVTCFLKDFNQTAVLVLFTILGCFSGYDPRLRDFFHLSRLFVYFPVFLLGYMCDPRKVIKHTTPPWQNSLALAG